MDTELEIEEEQTEIPNEEVVEDDISSGIDSEKESEQDEFLQAIFDINEIIDLLKENKVDSLESIKGCLLNIDVLLNYFQKEYSSLESFSKLKDYLSKEEEKISELISQNSANEIVIYELERLLKEVEDFYRNATKKEQEKLEPENEEEKEAKVESQELVQEETQVVSGEKELSIDPLELPEVDALYQELYDAIEKNDSKKETLYRGRIIRQLEKYEDLINEKFEQVEVLKDIMVLIVSRPSDLLLEVKELLSKPQNEQYYNYFEKSLQSEQLFKEKYYELCQRTDIVKIICYFTALKEELKMQGKKLDERYEREFLDKKAGVTSVATTLPKAVGLSIQKLANTIREAKEAKTKRKKVAKVLESIKAAGKVLVTPAVYLGKFAINNWYALYKVYQGYENAKVMIEEEKQARAEKETRAADAKSKATEEKQAIDEARAKAAKDAQDKAAESRRKMEEAEERTKAAEEALQRETQEAMAESKKQAEAVEAARLKAEAEERAKAAEEALQRETQEAMAESRKQAEAVDEARAGEEEKDPNLKIQPVTEPESPEEQGVHMVYRIGSWEPFPGKSPDINGWEYIEYENYSDIPWALRALFGPLLYLSRVPSRGSDYSKK